MKLSSQEEYGLRCLLHIARQGESGSLTIPQISEAEGISVSYAAKLMRLLRRGGFVRSVRGQAGGYTLARPATQITVGEAMAFLGGRLFEPKFCEEHTGIEKVCTHSVDCSIRSVWRTVQLILDRVLSETMLQDLLHNEQPMTTWLGHLVSLSGYPARTNIQSVEGKPLDASPGP